MDIKIACGQIEEKPAQPGENTKAILAMIDKAKKAQADILLLPEMAIPGYLLGDLWEQEAFLKDCAAYGEEVVAASQGLVVIFGNIAIDPAKYNQDGHMRKYNAAFVAQNGKLLQGALPYPFISKTSLPNYREFDDMRYFHSTIKLQPEIAPDKTVEDLLQPVEVTIRGEKIKLGVMLCEDGWTDNYNYNVPRILAKHGAQIICNISCSPFTLSKNNKRHRMFGAQAREIGLPIIYCNSVGVQNNGKDVFTFDGCSTIYGTDGTIKTNGTYFAPDFFCADWDTASGAISGENDPEPMKEETAAIYAALEYGAKHFLEATHIKKLTIGLSGGIDSAVAAAFYVHLLGPENVLLINMPSQYNSATTKDIAKNIAQALKTNYAIMPISGSVALTEKELCTTPIHNYGTGSEFKLEVSPFILENIQARDRGARVLAGAAAAFGGAFTCNGNKAETTVGYATFYGDMAGCLALLGDLWKHQVYNLGRYLNDVVYKRQVLPEEVFTIKPSAELSTAQTVGNGGDPIIYPYHDYLFASFIERWHKASPEDILNWYVAGTVEKEIGCEPGLVKQLFPTAEAFIKDLERWWNLFMGLSVAKRIQTPPLIAVSRRADGYDHREAQLPVYYSRKYLELKEQLLKK